MILPPADSGVLTQSNLRCLPRQEFVSTESKCCSDVFWLFVGVFGVTGIIAGGFGLAFYWQMKQKAKDMGSAMASKLPGMNRDVDIFDDEGESEDKEEGGGEDEGVGDEASGVLAMER